MVERVFFIAEMLGTVAFAVSGALMAVDMAMDVFGVLFLGAVSAVGGGMLRDTLLGRVPPAAFTDPRYILVALATSLVVFCIVYFTYDGMQRHRELVDRIINVFDAIGLGAFSVVGVQVTIAAGYGDNALLALFLGMTTAVGGGMLRDVLAGQKPFVLRKRIYALAALCGSLAYYLLRGVQETAAIVTGMVLVIAIRLLAAHFRWNLPRVHSRLRERAEDTHNTGIAGASGDGQKG